MDYLLLIDTSADTCTVALTLNGKVVAQQAHTDMRNHAAVINLMIADVVAAAGITLQDLKAVVACAGPGSYTGLRIGVATCKSLSYVLDKPLMMQDKLTLMSWEQYHKNLSKYEVYVSVLPARAEEYYITAYNSEFVCIVAPQHAEQSAYEKIMRSMEGNILYISPLTLGNELVEFHTNKSAVSTYTTEKINMETWAIYSYKRYLCNDFVILSSAEPFYLKQVYINK